MRVKPSEFDAGLLQFGEPEIFNNGGATIALKYDGESGLELKIPAGRVAFDCGFAKGSNTKLLMSIELLRTPEFQEVRGVLSAVDEASRKHLRDEADEICKDLKLKDADTIHTLRTGNNMGALVKPAKDSKYPDQISMKWMEKDKIHIIDTERNDVKWNSIGRGSTVEAFVNIKGIWVDKGNVTMQMDATGLKVKVCVKPKKRKLSLDDMFDD